MEPSANWYRIAELERLSGVSRRNVHFYLQQGLLHPPRRTGRTMAYYDDSHVAKLKLIRSARAKGLPLFAIAEQIRQRFGPGAQDAPASAAADAPARTPRPARKGRPSGRGDMREKIMTLACELFRNNGFRATVVSDITARLNVGKGTFYFYFSDKDDLFLACVPLIFRNLFSESWAKMRREHNALRRLELRAEAVLPVLGEFCSILALCREALESKHVKVRKIGEQTLASILHPLSEDLRAGMEQGLIRPVDPTATAAMFVGVIESLQYLQAVGATLSHEQLRRQVSSLILSGIEQREAPITT